MPQIREGKVRALAVTLPQRFPLAPEIPSAAETLPGYGFTFWFGMSAPAGTPAPVVARANAAMNKVLASPDLPTASPASAMCRGRPSRSGSGASCATRSRS
ncbi:tripartite tricarboxylate transporter substrate-binding protein [Siccirubricoccus deserti]